MKTSHLSLLTFTVLLGQSLTEPATADPSCESKQIDSLSGSETCWVNLPTPEPNYLASSISPPDVIALGESPPHTSASQSWIDSINSNHSSELEKLFHRDISALTALLLDLTLSPLGAIAFFLLIKPLLVQNTIADIREQISELGELELQLSTASQQAENLSNNFQLQLENLAHEYQQHFEKLKHQANQQGFAVQQFESIKSDWMSQLQNLVLAVSDAKDEAVAKIANIGTDNVLEKVYDRLLNHVEKNIQERLPVTPPNQGETGSKQIGDSIPTTEQDYLRQGNQLLQQGYYSDALIAYNQAIAANANNPEAWYQRGNVLVCLQQYQEALASYQKAIALQPERAEIWANTGHVLIRLQQHNEAIAAYEQAIKIQPNQAEYWQYQGNLLAKLQRYEAAMKAYEQASVLEPDKYEIWHLKGNLLAKLKQTEAAAIAYKQAVKIDPQKYESWYNLGNALGQLERYVESVNAYNQAIDLQSDDYKVWHNRGFMLGKMQRYEAAIASYDKATILNPQNYESWYNRGNLLEQLHRYDDAIASYDRAIEIQPDDPRLWYNCGRILEKLQRYEEALVSYEKAIKIQPDRSEEIRVSLNYLLAKLNHDPTVVVS